MDALKTKSTLDQAEEFFHQAEEEYSRPEEDVVPYSVCRGAYKAVDKYLSSFLMKNGIELHASTSMDEMLSLCRGINPDFQQLNLDSFFNTDEREDVYMDMRTVNHYMSLASKTRNLVVAQ